MVEECYENILKCSETIKNISLVLGVAGAGYGLWLARRRTRTDSKRLATENMIKALGLLKEDHKDIRTGGVLALEDVARLAPDLRGQIISTLCAFIRERLRPSDAAPVSTVGRSIPGVRGEGGAGKDVQEGNDNLDDPSFEGDGERELTEYPPEQAVAGDGAGDESNPLARYASASPGRASQSAVGDIDIVTALRVVGREAWTSATPGPSGKPSRPQYSRKLNTTNFSGIDVSTYGDGKWEFHHVDFSGSLFHEGKLMNVIFNNCDMTNTIIQESNLQLSSFYGDCIGISLNIQGAIVTGSKFDKMKMSSLQAKNLQGFDRLKMESCILTDADFSGSQRSSHVGSDEHQQGGPSFYRAILTRAKFVGADLSYANFYGAEGLESVDVTGAVITGVRGVPRGILEQWRKVAAKPKAVASSP